jgi:CubicO group peptidase (beta-lactamase class C family)
MSLLANCRNAVYRRIFRTVEVPQDLSGITDIDSASEVAPEAAELDEAAVNAIWAACEDLFRSGVYPMLSLCVRRHGKVVLNRSIGFAREEQVASVTTPVCLFSASKAVSAILVHLLEEQGQINLLNPVSYYIPAFAARGKGSITVHQLLTHRAGVPSVPKDVELDTLYDHDAGLAMICEAAPTDIHSRFQAYHAITGGFLINELIRVTTGLNAQQYIDRYIRKPMGMRYFRYGLTSRVREKVAINTTTGLDSGLINRALTSVLGTHPDTAVDMTNDPRFYASIIPSANLFGTAEEVSRFYEMLLHHGRWNGKKILEPLTVHRAVRPLGRTEIDRTLMLPMRYSAGFMLGGTPFGIYGKDTQYAFGHLGFANIFSWADPQRDISVCLMNTGKLTLGPHLKALAMLLAEISTQCEPVVDMESDIPSYLRPRHGAS